MNIRIKDLENFSETAQSPTMAEAARKLDMALPSLSESIKRLESDLNAVLFYRTRQGISLTSTGRELFVKAKGIINSLKEIEDINAQDSRLHSGTIRIGCHPLIGSYILPKALEKIYHSDPGVQIQLSHGLSREIQAQVQSGSVDIGIVVNPSPATDIIIRKIGVDEISVWTHDLKFQHERIIYDPNLFQVQSILRKWKKHPTNYLTTSSLELAASLTAQGLGYGIIPSRLVNLYGLPLKKVTHVAPHPDLISLVYRPEFGKRESEKMMIRNLEGSLK